MVLAVGLSLAMLNSQPRLGLAFQGGSLNQNGDSFDVDDVDINVVLKKIFKSASADYMVSPRVKGTVTGHFKNAKLELVLQSMLIQVNATYRYEGGKFLIIRRPPPNGEVVKEEMPNFVSGSPSSQWHLKPSSLFMSPKQTKGGTYDLLVESVREAGFRNWETWTYGENGFAISLPFEAIDEQGQPLSLRSQSKGRTRFGLELPNLSEFGMEHLTELFSRAYNNLDQNFRMIVIAVSNDGPGLSKVQMRPSDEHGLPEDVRLEKWVNTPTAKAFVYEFRRPAGQHVGVLVTPGQGMSAQQHLMFAGLWTAKELR